MAALPYMQLYVADYLADTFHLTTEEHGAYLLILMTYWQRGKPIHKDRLAKAARLSNERWTDVERTLNEYFVEDANGCWINERIEADLDAVLLKSKQNSAAGKRSAASRARKKAEKDAVNKGAGNERSTNATTNAQRKANHIDTDTDTYKDQEKGEKQKPATKRFAQPTIIETAEYAASKKLNLTGFFNYYESNGWMVGKNKMKDWQAAARGWDDRQTNNGANHGTYQQNTNKPKSHHHQISEAIDRNLQQSFNQSMG